MFELHLGRSEGLLWLSLLKEPSLLFPVVLPS